MNIGIIGSGNRASMYIPICLSDIRGDVVVKALSDNNEEKLRRFADRYFKGSSMPALYMDYNDLLEDDGIDAVIICTPDVTHAEVAVAALKKNMHILLEKPIATTIEDSIRIYRESLKHDTVLIMGFVLRYTSLCSKIKEIVSKGELGQLISMEAKEVLGYMHGASFFRRMHRFNKNSGGFLNTKCCHHLDLLNWIAGVDPLYVSAFGSRSYFKYNENAAAECRECKLKNECRYFVKSTDFGEFDPTEAICPFNSEKDIVDHEVVNIEYENGLTTSFTLTTLGHEANVTLVIFGSEATLYADFTREFIEVKRICPKDETVYKFDVVSDGHGGGDYGIYKYFIDAIRTNSSINDAKAGMMSSLITLSAEDCMAEKKVVDLRSLLV